VPANANAKNWTKLHSTSHSHTEHYHSNNAESNEPIVDGVTTKDGLFLTGIPLDLGTAFYSMISAILIAA